MGGENRGGLPDLDPNLSKSRGGHPNPDPELSIYPDLSRLSWPKKLVKVRIYLDSPRLCAQKPGRIKIYPDSSRLIPNYLKILKSRDGHPDSDPELSKSWGGLPDPDPDLSRPNFCRDFIPLEISRP